MLLPVQNCCYVGYKSRYDSLQMGRRSQVGTILGTSHAGQLRKTHKYLLLPTSGEDIIKRKNYRYLLLPTCSEVIRVKEKNGEAWRSI